MLIVLLDEPGLFVYSSPEEAARHIEGPEAKHALRAAFDSSAVPYRVEWLRALRTTWFGGIDIGSYRFVPSGPEDKPGLIRLLTEHPDYTTPPEATEPLRALLARLKSPEAS